MTRDLVVQINAWIAPLAFRFGARGRNLSSGSNVARHLLGWLNLPFGDPIEMDEFLSVKATTRVESSLEVVLW